MTERTLETLEAKLKTLVKVDFDYLKKNYKDPTAVFIYQNGCSIVHLSLFVVQYLIIMPDIEKAKEVGPSCLKMATVSE